MGTGAAIGETADSTIHDPHLQQARAIGVCSRDDCVLCLRNTSTSSRLTPSAANAVWPACTRLDQRGTPNGGTVGSNDSAADEIIENLSHDGCISHEERCQSHLTPDQHVLHAMGVTAKVFKPQALDKEVANNIANLFADPASVQSEQRKTLEYWS